MLTIIHGEDVGSSRKYFIDLKQKHTGLTLINGQDLQITDLTQLLEGGSLFDEEKILFIEQLLPKNKKSSDYKQIISYINEHSSDSNITIWENKEIAKSTLNLFNKASIKFFKLPTTLFAFLDNLKPDNGIQSVKLYHQTMENIEEENIFYMLIRHFRLLLSLHPSSYSPLLEGSGMHKVHELACLTRVKGQGEVKNKEIEELKRLQPWQESKLEGQAKLFTTTQLLDVYNKLFKIEKEYKTGKIVGSLTSNIDILLLDI